MSFNSQPVSRLGGRIRLPASKSYSIRAFFVAACGGKSTILHASDCDDAKVARRLTSSLGAGVLGKYEITRVDALARSLPAVAFDVNESGTSLRFLLPLLAVFTNKALVKGKGTLIGRPNQHLCTTLREQGLNIKGVGIKESVPITYKGGKITQPNIVIDGSLSSQFVSALLITAPLLPHDVTIRVKGKMVSVDYITMTLQILAKAGIKIKVINQHTYQVKGGQTYKGLKNFYVPSDYGLAAFSLAAGVLLPSDIVLDGYFNDRFVQADGHILKFLKQMGVRYKKTSAAIRIKGPQVLKGGSFDLTNCPDLVPIMAVLAMFAKGKTVLKGIAHARVKESDRIGDLSRELEKVGARFKIGSDSLTILPQEKYKTGILLDSHRDHRLAMAFSVLGAKIGCRINDLECTHKSYPAFVKDMRQLGFRLK